MIVVFFDYFMPNLSKDFKLRQNWVKTVLKAEKKIEHNWALIELKLSQNETKWGKIWQKLCRNWAKFEQKPSQNWAKTELTMCQKLRQNWNITKPQLSQNWDKIEPKLRQNWDETETKLSHNLAFLDHFCVVQNQKPNLDTFLQEDFHLGQKLRIFHPPLEFMRKLPMCIRVAQCGVLEYVHFVD